MKQKVDKATHRKAILEACRLAGCTCDPLIRIKGQVNFGEYSDITVGHDDWCPALGKFNVAVIVAPDPVLN